MEKKDADTKPSQEELDYLKSRQRSTQETLSHALGSSETQIPTQQNLQHFFTRIFFEGGAIEACDVPEFKFKFLDGKKITINSEELTHTFEQFVAEMKNTSIDRETATLCSLIASNFSKELKNPGICPFFDLCYRNPVKSSILSLYGKLEAGTHTPKDLFWEAFVIVSCFLNPNGRPGMGSTLTLRLPYGKVDMNSTLLLPYIREIAAWFDKVIKLSIAIRLDCIQNDYIISSRDIPILFVKGLHTKIVTPEEYLKKVFVEFNDAKLTSFAMKVAFNFAKAVDEEMKKETSK